MEKPHEKNVIIVNVFLNMKKVNIVFDIWLYKTRKIL